MARFELSLFFKRYWYPLAGVTLILCGVAARLALVLLGWPHSNSEEGTMGLEAAHILLRGERPIYLYGQNYMGVSEAYLGALAFWVFGISLVSLRLGMIALYAVFMLSVFWLASLLYSRRVALASLAALALGTPFAARIELLADGGKAETLALGALMFALAAWLALSRPVEGAPRGRRSALRSAAFVAWGLSAGLGLYTYAIITPLVLTSGLLLWLTCRRELRGWTLALPLVGLLIGLLPAIIYTLTAPFADNPVFVFLSLHQTLNAHADPGWLLLLKQIDGSLLFTLPMVTGLISLYPLQALPSYGPPSPATVVAVFLGGGWSLGYLLLLSMATFLPLRALRRVWAPRWIASRSASASQANDAAPSAAIVASVARDLARLLLALAAWLTIVAYTFSATAANNPYSARYMTGLLVITPVVLWPLLEWAPGAGATRAGPPARAGAAALRRLWRPIGVAVLLISLALGVYGVAQSVPDAIAADGRDVRFAHDLLHHGVTRFYSDYWTCDLLNFETREQLTCAVINDYAQPGLTRYAPYYAEVRADPGAPYVLARGSQLERTFLIHAAQNHLRYTMTRLDGRDIYTPALT